MLADADVVEVDRRRGFRVVRRHGVLILVTLVLFGALGVVYGSKHHSYTATSVVRVAKPIGLYLPGTTRTSNDDQRATVNETQILESQGLADKVAHKLGFSSVSVTIAPIDGGDVVDISASSHSPKTAEAIANTMADTYVSERTSETNGQVDSALSKIGHEIRINRERVASYDHPDATPIEATLRGIANTRINQLQGQQASYEEAESVGSALPAVTVKATRPHRDHYRSLLEFGLIGVALGLLIGILVASILERTRSLVFATTDVVELGALSPPRAIALKGGRSARRRAAEASAVRTLTRSILDQDTSRAGWLCACVAFDGRSNEALLTQLRAQTDAWGHRVAVVRANFDAGSTAHGPALSLVLANPATTRSKRGAADPAYDLLGKGATVSGAASGVGRSDPLAELREAFDGVIVDVDGLESLLQLASLTRPPMSCFLTMAPNTVRRDDLARQLEELSGWDVPVLAAVLRPAGRTGTNRAAPGDQGTPPDDAPPAHDTRVAASAHASRD